MTNEFYYITTLQYNYLSSKALQSLQTTFEDCIQGHITLDDLYDLMGWAEDLEHEKDEDKPQIKDVQQWLQDVNAALLEAIHDEQHNQTITDLQREYNNNQ